MSSLSNNSRPDSSIISSREVRDFTDTNGWFEQSGPEFDRIFEDKGLIIKLANEKIKLNNIFSKYKINFSEIYSPSGWTHKASCPFPDHNERTPSFNYNPIENRFNCFGCSRGGGPVDFISYYENKPHIEVARQLLNDKIDIEEIIDYVESPTDDEFFKLLNDFALIIYNFNNSENFNKEAIDFSEKVSLIVDMYVRNHLRTRSININQLQTRIEIAKRYLKEYKE